MSRSGIVWFVANVACAFYNASRGAAWWTLYSAFVAGGLFGILAMQWASEKKQGGGKC